MQNKTFVLYSKLNKLAEIDLGCTHATLPFWRRIGVASARRLRTRVPFRDTCGCLARARAHGP